MITVGGQNIVQAYSYLMVHNSRKVWWNVRIGSFCPKWGILLSRMDLGGTTWKWIWLFSNTKMNAAKWMLLLSIKGRCKNEVICLVSMFPSLVMILKLFKKVQFLQFCVDLSKKSNSVKANLRISIWKFSLHSFRKY